MENINIGIANLVVSNRLKDTYFKNGMNIDSKEYLNEFSSTIDLVSIIKSSPILQLEFRVFNNIENKHIENDLIASRYIDNNIKLFEIYTIKEIETEHLKLKEYINEDVSTLNNDKVLLYNAIYTLIKESLNDYDKVNVDNIHESFTFVLNHIKQSKINGLDDNDNSTINEDVISIAVDKFNEKYDNLDENDKNLLLTLIKANDDEKKELLETYKSESLVLLESINKDNVRENILKAIQKVMEMKYKKDSVEDDIIGLYELKKGLL